MKARLATFSIAACCLFGCDSNPDGPAIVSDPADTTAVGNAPDTVGSAKAKTGPASRASSTPGPMAPD